MEPNSISLEQIPATQVAGQENYIMAAQLIRRIINDAYADVRETVALDGGTMSPERLRELRVKGDHRALELAQALVSNDNRDVEKYIPSAATAAYDERREKGYHRLIVTRFAHLFEVNSSKPGKVFSRRMLPGIFMAIDLILGPKLRASFDARSQEILRNMVDGGEEVAGESSRLMTDILIEVAVAFERYERRASWFIKMINGHLAPRTEQELAGEVAEIDGEGVMHLLRTLFLDVRYDVETAQRRPAMAQRYGDRKITIVREVLDRLWLPVMKRATHAKRNL